MNKTPTPKQLKQREQSAATKAQRAAAYAADPDKYLERIRRSKFNSHWTIYGVYRVSDSQLLYVGQTQQKLHVRLADHRRHARNGRKFSIAVWLRDNPDVVVEIREIERASDELSAKRREAEVIKSLVLAGVDLVNVLVGDRGRVADLRRRVA